MSSWFTCFTPHPQSSIRLFCFPYAGGGVPVFRGWAEGLPGVELWAAYLPGRGSRFREAALTSMPALVQELARHLPLDSRPFAFFGHSMGAHVAFELARELRRRGQMLPVRLFISACPAPQLPLRPALHNLPKDAFLAELRRRKGIPAELLAEPELLDLLLPIVRADLQLYETAVYEEEPLLPCPITAFGGSADPVVSREELTAWSTQTSGAFEQILFPGDHFFLRTAEKKLLRAIHASTDISRSSP